VIDPPPVAPQFGIARAMKRPKITRQGQTWPLG